MKKIISYGLYPFLLIIGLGACILSIYFDWNPANMFTFLAAGRFTILLVVEYIYPINKNWKMTWKSFFRDLKYAFVVGVISFGIKYLIGLYAIKNAVYHSVLSDLPVILSAIIALLCYEFLQYWFHRISHESKGKFGTFLWKVHAAHHLPDKVYLLMHPVSHPINAIVVLLISQIVFVGLGVNGQALLLINTIIGLQGLISHFNVEIKAGWLNYVFIGTELHRFHHSADVHEAQNFGAVLTVWDLIFGTFYYSKDAVPKEIGVFQPENYPDSNDIFKVIAFPFKKN
jgi:sterol desaturase/sphingolipid hydroxylase (fatty acid hydroxylase superfamily)